MPNTALKWPLTGASNSSRPTGLTAIELFEQVRSGKIKALWIACTNPAQSMPDQNAVRAAANLSVRGVAGSVSHHRNRRIRRPVATCRQLGRKRRPGDQLRTTHFHVRQAIVAPGEARPDWAITVDFAQRLEKYLRPGQPSLFAFEAPAQLFDEFKQLTRGRDLDLSGISHGLIDRIGPQQWPFRECQRRHRTPVRRRRLPDRQRSRTIHR
jgi:assimilatory nitrate reductase catalytic subunit